MKPRVLVALHDAGGAAAIRPLITALENIFDFQIFAHDMAASELAGISFKLCSSITAEKARETIGAIKPALVLTGTSLPGDTIDRAFVLAAKQKNAPTLAVLDYWSNYRKRFIGSTNELTHLPDRVAVMNEDAKKEMIADGIPEQSIIVTGSPRFEALAAQKYDRDVMRDALARRLDISLEKPWILFLSQPFAAVYGNAGNAREQIGYTEEDAIRMLAAAKGPAKILARLHPREGQANLKLFESLLCIPANDCELLSLLAACDLVCGMSSVAMIDAYLMKRPVISVQPSQKGHDFCYLTRNRLIPLCVTPEETAQAVSGTVSIDFSRGSLFESSAIENIRKIMTGMALKSAA